MADKGNKLGLNITIPNNEALLSTYDSEKDAWVIHVQVNEPVDELTGNIRMITQEHHEIHEGDHVGRIYELIELRDRRDEAVDNALEDGK